MLVSHTHKFVFIHVYKTGGTSIEKALKSISISEYFSYNNHSTAGELREALPPAYGSYTWFSVIRNPFDLNVSLWRFISESHRHQDHDAIVGSTFPEFADWLNAKGWSRWKTDLDWQVANKRSRPPRYLTLEEFVCDNRGQLLVDRVLRQESLSDDFRHLCQDLEIETELPYLNRSRHDHYRSYYDNRSRRLIEQYHARDLELFGYQF